MSTCLKELDMISIICKVVVLDISGWREATNVWYGRTTYLLESHGLHSCSWGRMTNTPNSNRDAMRFAAGEACSKDSTLGRDVHMSAKTFVKCKYLGSI